VTRLQKALIRLDTDLRALGLQWALVGGFAVVLRAEPRSTRDLDIVLATLGDRQTDDAVLGLRSRGYTDHPTKPMLMRKDGRLFGVRLVSPILGDDQEEETIVDLLLGCSGVEAEIIAAADLLEVLPNVLIPVAQPEHLIAMKVLAGRPQDLEDVRSLLRESDFAVLQSARQTLQLIEERGFNEDKDLLVELGKLMDSLDE
jgi:Nucleotidyl transferase AbiEii toxin, Type IV TA system